MSIQTGPAPNTAEAQHPHRTAWTALALGLLSTVLLLWSLYSAPLALAPSFTALLLGLQAHKDLKRRPDPYGRTLAITATLLGAATTAISASVTACQAFFVSALLLWAMTATSE
ncbi:hypothetical protein ACIHFE_34040 [Streptomyces sp. NPDC052396]|uniref:hypothetical protein n=1 Tax=Streptomyces sp. NPDC052396 TaxID=3365689 RepID=UPI0037D5716A